MKVSKANDCTRSVFGFGFGFGFTSDLMFLKFDIAWLCLMGAILGVVFRVVIAFEFLVCLFVCLFAQVPGCAAWVRTDHSSYGCQNCPGHSTACYTWR